ncbi:OsmC family peroxiredoxin [Putridiphycobacter roseus]|uniref:OsmC family peroxiredoxin n=1 Tax=Putridiphycobacter roseus TaxID=2219161 RepID=A0A2W1NDF1_9FLAO|nr:OsmC family protein [Putridiphycobacter roseus]PZE17455.1 OsmC family peroxiredoxin [Putridiphycobacter roseus]
MIYQIHAASISNQDAEIKIKESKIDFGTTTKTAKILPNPAELFLGSFAACMLKNVERFSLMMQFTFLKAEVEVKAIRLENPPRMENILYELTIYTDDLNINTVLLKKNIENHGTIYNTIKLSSKISGTIKTIKNV